MFRRAVPLSKLQNNYDRKLDSGPVCHPTLVGPKDSNKLAILLHGFLACPGLWFRIVPRLIANGFRVLLPTLPGHGRKWINPKGDRNSDANVKVVDLDEDPITNETGDGDLQESSDLGIDLRKADDDIEDIPTDPLPYQIFARTLGELAKQFKKDHPGAVIAVGGHSLGGALTAYYAMDIPEVIDRVMLFNPMFKLSSGWSSMMASWFSGWQLSKGSKCESQRGTGSGGQCQFTLAHVKAMERFGVAMFCHWGLRNKDKCHKNRHNQVVFRQMKEFQVVSSREEGSVDYSWIERFVRAVQQQRLSRHGVASGPFNEKSDPTSCLWPKELGHSYLSNRVTPSSPEKWWHPYVESVSEVFLSTGKNIDLVGTGFLSDGNDCLKKSSDVAGEYLSVLPALQHEKVYHMKAPVAGSQPVVADVLFSGHVQKESDGGWKTNDRHIELLAYNSQARRKYKHLIVTRKTENDNIRNIYVIRKGSQVNLRKQQGGSICMEVRSDEAEVGIPLDEALRKAYSRNHKTRKICGPRELADALCSSFRSFRCVEDGRVLNPK